MGISSIQNVWIDNCSIGAVVADILKEYGYEVVVHDPFLPASYSMYEVCKDIDKEEFGTVIVFTPHDFYNDVSFEGRHDLVIIDSFGIFKERIGDNKYYEVGCRCAD